MQTRKLGSLDVSIVGLGSNNFGTDFFGNACNQDDAARVVHAALDAGINFIDTAEEYSTATNVGTGRSEEYIRSALGPRRSEVIIASKFRNDSLSAPDQRGARRIVAALEDTLNRLGTDYVDLYQQHTPDPDTPMDEVLEAMDRLVRDGKVREIGCCNYSGALIDQARKVSDDRNLSPFVSSQSRYNLLQMPRQEGVLEACQRHGMALLPYFPLASGLLTGKYRAGEDPADGRLAAETAIGKGLRSSLLTEGRLQTVGELERFAQEHGHTLLELAISWLTSQPVVGSVIAGATRPEQVAANAAAANWELSDDEFQAVAAIVKSTPAPPRNGAKEG
jgi:aryl-alcohol dehydrogenase-like predicted oxidoreductase